MGLFDFLGWPKPEAEEANKQVAQTTRTAGPAGQVKVGKSAGYKKGGKAGKDLDGGAASPSDTRRGQVKVGKSSGIKAPKNPKNVTPSNTKRGK